MLAQGPILTIQEYSHESESEKSSYILFGIACHPPTEAELSSPPNWMSTDATAY